MKPLKLISSIILVVCLAACEPLVTFKEPQPAGKDNLLEFPKRLQGQYLSLADSSTLFISDKLIQRVYDVEQKIHPSELDSHTKLSGDTLFNLTINSSEIIKRDGDSLITHIHYVDTLFLMDYDNVARKFKGYYFINKRFDKDSWEVKKIELSKGQLVVSSISTKEDIENLTAITESTQDTVAPFKFTATKKQFKEFVKNNGFSESETFIKQK
ncbi:MAG TPA: hypothetical protein PLU17_04445 [Chitinophagaceae bacterium]|nr:hypothetical protein [Chitinophagaceae bacterium]